jgi:integrase
MTRSKRQTFGAAIPNTSVYRNRQRVGTFIAEDRRGRTRVRKTFDSEEAAWAYLGSIQSIAQGNAGNITVQGWLHRWLDGLDPDLAASTVSFYEFAVERWSKSRYGTKKLTALTTDDVEAQLRLWLAERTYSASTTTHLKRVLSTALNEAIRYKLIAVNPVAQVRRVGKAPARRISTISLGRSVMRQLSDAWADHPLRLQFEILLHTGMRPGELLALTWNDINLAEKEIHVHRGLQTLRKSARMPEARGSKKWQVGSTKTSSSNRRIAIDDQLVRLLFKAYREAGSPKGELGNQWLFERSDDPTMPMTRDFLSHSFKKILNEKRIGFRPGEKTSQYRLYDLRGLHASLLIHSGWDPVRVATRLGHTDIVSTFRRYAGSVTERDREGLEGARLWPNTPKQSRKEKVGAEGGD